MTLSFQPTIKNAPPPPPPHSDPGTSAISYIPYTPPHDTPETTDPPVAECFHSLFDPLGSPRPCAGPQNVLDFTHMPRWYPGLMEGILVKSAPPAPPHAARQARECVTGYHSGSPLVSQVEKWGRGGWETERMILAPEDAQDCTRIYYRGFVVTGNGLFQLWRECRWTGISGEDLISGQSTLTGCVLYSDADW